MYSNSNSFYMPLPKIEIDSEIEATSYDRDSRYNWNSENTMKLIDTFEKDCKELWDVKHPSNKDRVARQARMEYLANVFGTSADEISRKIHNLRTQFNNELRKIKRRSGGEGGVVGSSGWEYFDALTFLLRSPPDPLDSVDAVNLALAEFQADEEVEFGLADRANVKKPKTTSRVATSAPSPLPPSAYPMMWPVEPLPRIKPYSRPDECQIFGRFVASEMRSLRSEASRRKLKRIIQKAILQVVEEDDLESENGCCHKVTRRASRAHGERHVSS